MDGKDDHHHRNWTKPRILYKKIMLHPYCIDIVILAKGETKECVGRMQMNVQNVFVLANLI